VTDAIDDFFGEGGTLSQQLRGYAPRPGQITMAHAIDEAILLGRNAVIEAPVATGKSLAYLVPTVRWAVEKQRRVLIATANIALQEQLIFKDLPFLQKHLGVPFEFAIAKGRNNYLCRYTFNRFNEDQQLDMFEKDPWSRITEWANQTKSGDVSELPFEPAANLREHMTVTSDDCLRKKCPERERCFAEQARKRLADSHVVVSNYHLLWAHCRVLLDTGQPLVLPEFDIVVLDEAHKASGIAQDFFGMRVTEYGLRRLARHLPKNDPARSIIATAATEFFYQLARVKESLKPRYRRPLPFSADTLVAALGAVERAYANDARRQPNEEEAEAVEHHREKCAVAASTVKTLAAAEETGSVYFVDDGGRSVALCSKPIDVGPFIRTSLFDHTRSAILTSATVSVGGSFDHIIRETGVPDCDTLEVPSPFDWQRQAALVAHDSAPDPNDPGFGLWCAKEIEKIILAAHGRTLALFTSRRNLDAAHQYLSGRSLPYKILRQDEAPRTRLIGQFREDISSCLLGTESFWAGMDVPGESCSVVVIDKIPFPHKDDPVLDAISSSDKNWFKRYSIPRAVIQFKQGFGRLIRSTTDLGVVVVLDARLAGKGYGKTFIRSLPSGMRVYGKPEDAIRDVLGTGP